MDDYRRDIARDVPRLAVEFFATFSRFEFALKRGGFLLGELDGIAAADWDEFARALGAQFFAAMRREARARVFFENQPKWLVRVGGDEVAFRELVALTNSQRLFEAVRRVRNNLFHGEKVRLGQRDQELITASLFVLDAAMARCGRNGRGRRVAAAFAFAVIDPQ